MKLLKILFSLIILFNLHGCSMLRKYHWYMYDAFNRLLNRLFYSNVQGTYYLNASFSQLYYDDSMKVVLDSCSKGYLTISDTTTCYFLYDSNFEESNDGTRRFKIIFDEKDSLGFDSKGMLIRNHLIITAPDHYIFFKKSRR